jgi:hypothetical protein
LDHILSRSKDDARSPAASFELAIYYYTSFGIQHKTVVNGGKMQVTSAEKLLLAAQQDDPMAILTLIPACKGLNHEHPPDIPIRQWLRGLVEENGSRVALSSPKGPILPSTMSVNIDARIVAANMSCSMMSLPWTWTWTRSGIYLSRSMTAGTQSYSNRRRRAIGEFTSKESSLAATDKLVEH